MPFKRGNKLSKGGRPKGIPNKSTRIIRNAFIDVFRQIGGVKALKAWAEKEPTEYFKLASKLLPREMEVSGPDGGPIKTSVEVVFIGANPKNKS